MATRILAETMTADLDDLSFGRRVIRRRRDPDGHVTVHPSSFHPCYALLVDLILRGLANDPRDRPIAAEMLDELARTKEVLISKALDVTGMPVGKTGRSPKALRRAVVGRKGRVRKQVMLVVDGDKKVSEATEENPETREENFKVIKEDANMTEDEDASGEASTETEDRSDMSEYEGAKPRQRSAAPAISTEGVLTRSQRRASMAEDWRDGTRETPVSKVAANAPRTTGKGKGKTKHGRAGELGSRQVLASAHQQNKTEEERFVGQVKMSRLVESRLEVEVEVITLKKKRVRSEKEEGETDEPRRMTRSRSLRKELGGKSERKRTANRVALSEGRGKENR